MKLILLVLGPLFGLLGLGALVLSGEYRKHYLSNPLELRAKAMIVLGMVFMLWGAFLFWFIYSNVAWEQ